MTPHCSERIPYGNRLLPQLVDGFAEDEPGKLIGLIAKSSDISEGFTKVTFKDLSNAVNHIAWWIQTRIGPAQGRTISYMVRRLPSKDKSTSSREQGVTDFRYTVMELASIKCGHTVSRLRASLTIC